MRVWDIHPGYLNRQSLLGEHREIHAIYTILSQGKKGYSRHPETLRWQGYLDALVMRHQQVVAEMVLRGFRHHSPLAAHGPHGACCWPAGFVDPPGRQFAILQGKYHQREQGRIPLPRSATELQGHHALSLVAREWLALPQAADRGGEAMMGLAEGVVVCLRLPPTRRGLRTLWREQPVLRALARTVARGAMAALPVLPWALAQATLVSDLLAWCRMGDGFGDGGVRE